MSYKVITNKAQKSAEIFLYEDIGEGWFGGVSAKQFADDLKGLGDVNAIDVRINSPGGSVFEGNTIYNLLRDHAAHVVTHVDGLAASIASVVAMAGDEVLMAENALMMIHDPWGMVVGTAKDMRREAEVLEQVRDTILGTYVRRTGRPGYEVSNWMADETWMSADEAMERGFIDSIAQEMRQAAAVDWRRYGYRHAPKGLVRPQASRPRAESMAPGFMRMQKTLRRLQL